jgi:hypothetical protein
VRHPRLLHATWLRLRWMFRSEPNLRREIQRVAEMAAEDDLGPGWVLNAIIDRFDWLPADALAEIWAALEQDLPLDDLGALVLDGFRLRGERRFVS